MLIKNLIRFKLPTKKIFSLKLIFIIERNSHSLQKKLKFEKIKN